MILGLIALFVFILMPAAVALWSALKDSMGPLP